MDRKQYRYAYSILYYEGDKTREAGECRGFVEELHNRFKTRTGNQYKTFWHWNETVGKNKFDLLPKVREDSKLTIILFSPHFISDEWHNYSHKQAFMFHLATERLLPVSIMDGKIPEHLAQITPLKFHLDWRDDSNKWRILLNAICENLSDVQMCNPGNKIPQFPVSSVDDEDDNEEYNVMEFPNNDQLEDLADNIGHEKNQIGTRLGFKHAELEKIENDHMRNTYNQIQTMLLTWRQRCKLSAEEKSNKLQACFKRSGRADLADKVKKFYKEYSDQVAEQENVQQKRRAQKALKVKDNIEADQIKNAEEISAREKETIDHIQQLSVKDSPKFGISQQTSFDKSKSKMITGKEENEKVDKERSSLFDHDETDLQSREENDESQQTMTPKGDDVSQSSYTSKNTEESLKSMTPKGVEESQNCVTNACNVSQLDNTDEVDGQKLIEQSYNSISENTPKTTEGTDTNALKHTPKSNESKNREQEKTQPKKVAIVAPLDSETANETNDFTHLLSIVERVRPAENVNIRPLDGMRENGGETSVIQAGEDTDSPSFFTSMIDHILGRD